MDAILADLAARYPDGYMSFSKAGKRYDRAVIYPLKIGYGTNVNGARHIYDHDGVFIEVGHWGGRRQPAP